LTDRFVADFPFDGPFAHSLVPTGGQRRKTPAHSLAFVNNLIDICPQRS
jgi:hypothetical protein